MVNLQRENQIVGKIVLLIIQSEGCKSELLVKLTMFVFRLPPSTNLVLLKKAGEQMVIVGYSRDCSMSGVMETFCGLSLTKLTTWR